MQGFARHQQKLAFIPKGREKLVIAFKQGGEKFNLYFRKISVAKTRQEAITVVWEETVVIYNYLSFSSLSRYGNYLGFLQIISCAKL